MTEPTPVLVLTGALGAGKTTLLARWLSDPGLARTALVIDEISDVAVDPHLLPGSPAQVRRAPCGHWTDALRELAAGGDGFERVVVEANGAAAPARVLDALEGDDGLARQFRIAGIVAAIDASVGAAGLQQPHTRALAACADAIVLTKLDIAQPEGIAGLAGALARLNPYVEIFRASSPQLGISSLWSAVEHAPGRDLRRVQGLVEEGHAPQLGALCVKFAHAVELSGFCVRLGAFLEQHAAQVLRVKGLVRVEGRHGPAVIQAVGASLYPVRTLKEWPAGVNESALVVVARGIPDDELRVAVQSAGAARAKPVKAKR